MTYQEILKSIGWPTNVLVLDFETFFDSDYSLSKMSTIEYIQDKRFDFTGMGYQVLNERPIGCLEFETASDSKLQFVFKPELKERIRKLRANFGKNLEQVTVIAKNCKFDMTILATKFNIIPPYIIDIDDLLRHYDSRMSHKMKDVTKIFGLQAKGDTSQFKGLKYENMDQNTRISLKEYGKSDVEIEVQLFKILLPKITNPMVELLVARHTLDLYLKPKIKFDFGKAGELRIAMQEELDKIVDITECTKKELSGNLSFVEILQRVLPKNERVPVKPGKPGKNMTKLLGTSGVIPALAKDDLGFQNLLVHSDKTIRNLCVARQAVKSWPLHVKRITNMVNQANASDDLLRVDLRYYGAHTGRFSGAGGINLQNLGGRGRGGQGTHPLIQQMRELLCAPDGSILGIADSDKIEARILAWLAGQNDLVKEFADGVDVYSVFASKLFNSAVYKPKENEPDPIKRLLKIRRGFGKDAILGCGYTMGTNKFYNNCITNSDLRPLFDSGKYDWDFIDSLIRTYRTTYSQIPEFWSSVEKAFKWVIKYPHEIMVDSHELPRLKFWNNNGTVHLQLPSGRELTYRHCALKQTTRGSQIRWHWGYLYGGLLVENIVQAVARDLLAHWILEMDKAGLPVVLTSHDEIVCMLKKNDVNALDDMLNIMRTGPDWASGLPLDAEGCLSERYKK